MNGSNGTSTFIYVNRKIEASRIEISIALFMKVVFILRFLCVCAVRAQSICDKNHVVAQSIAALLTDQLERGGHNVPTLCDKFASWFEQNGNEERMF